MSHAARNDVIGSGAQYGSPTTGPCSTSSIDATSRTDRAIGPKVANPAHASPATGDIEIRPRDGLIPTTPQQAAGIRIEPPPSLPCASEPSPAASALPAPPLDPPARAAHSQRDSARSRRA